MVCIFPFSLLPRISFHATPKRGRKNKDVMCWAQYAGVRTPASDDKTRHGGRKQDNRKKGHKGKNHIIFQTPFHPRSHLLDPLVFPFSSLPNGWSTGEPRKTRGAPTPQLPPIHKRENYLPTAILYSLPLLPHPLPSSPPPRPPLPEPVLNRGSRSPPSPNSPSILVGRPQAERPR